MPLTIDMLTRALKSIDLRPLIDPEYPNMLFVHVQVAEDRAFNFSISIDADGAILQCRSHQYLFCKDTHPNFGAVLRELALINYKFRFTKFGWDTDGEVAAWADLLLADSEPTQEQISGLVVSFVRCAAESYGTIKQTMEHGGATI
jgi:hypothetical protein